MLHEVDLALRAFLAPHLPQTATLTFERPGDGDAGPSGDAERGPEVSLFLHQVCEDTSGRNASWSDVRDGSRKVVSRREPVRRYQLSYLVSVCASTAAAAHETLGQVLAAFAGADVVPPDCLSGSLAECRLPVELHVGSPVGTESARAVWSALGPVPRAFVDLTVTAPLRPATSDVAAAATKFTLDFNTDASPPHAASSTGAAPKRRFTTVRVRENHAPFQPRRLQGTSIDESQAVED